MAKIAPLTPKLFEKVWGGTSLLKHYPEVDLDNLGESWVVSTLAEGPSDIAGTALNQFCELSYLIKFIDTSKDLSIQVHPHDAYAKMHPEVKPKTESWLILDAKPDAGIYLGFKSGVTKKEFMTALKSGLAIDKFLNFHPVKPGDFFHVEGGTIHAIGKGVTLCEVQQSSGVTYRVWDWNRPGLDGKLRPLHIEEALECLEFGEKFYQQEVLAKFKSFNELEGVNQIFSHPDYKIQHFSKMHKSRLELNLKAKESVVVLNGSLSGDIDLPRLGAGFVLESGIFEFEITPNTEFIIVS